MTFRSKFTTKYLIYRVFSWIRKVKKNFEFIFTIQIIIKVDYFKIISLIHIDSMVVYFETVIDKTTVMAKEVFEIVFYVLNQFEYLFLHRIKGRNIYKTVFNNLLWLSFRLKAYTTYISTNLVMILIIGWLK